MTREEALRGTIAPQEIQDNLALVAVPFFSFEGKEELGHLVVHTSVAEEVEEIFARILALRFPIERIVPVSAYDWSDEASMQDNNTSSFNYRKRTEGDQISWHSHGLAIDVNTYLNPYVGSTGLTVPEGATYDPSRRGAITAGSAVVTIFKEYGWSWGGDWTSHKDWQHFEKPAA